MQIVISKDSFKEPHFILGNKSQVNRKMLLNHLRMFDLAAANFDVDNKIMNPLPFDLARRDRAPTEGREPETICQFLWQGWPASMISRPAGEETAISCDYNGPNTSGKMSRSGSRQEGRHVRLYRPQSRCEWDGPQTGNPLSRARDCSFLAGPAKCNCGYLVRHTCKRLARQSF